MNRRYLLAVLALFAALPCFSGLEARNKPNELMRKKLEHSQKILEGLAINDFDKIATNAEELIAISKLAEWQTIKTPQYEVHSNEFRRTAEALVQNAKAKNLDGAALNYVDLTLHCVKCHKYVREVRMTRLEEKPATGGR